MSLILAQHPGDKILIDQYWIRSCRKNENDFRTRVVFSIRDGGPYTFCFVWNSFGYTAMKNRIKQIRAHQGISQEEFAHSIGKTSGFISFLETGRSGISEETINRICTTYNVSEEWLRTGIGAMFSSEMDAADKAGVGPRIKTVRNNTGLTQAEFGKKIGFSKKQVYNVEKGISFPSNEFLHKVEQVYNISFDWLLKGTGEMGRPADVIDDALLTWMREHPEVIIELRKRSGLL